MICEDFIMLGKTVPESRKDGRVSVCCAGWSPEMRSFVRIYPLAMQGAPKMWSRSCVALERPVHGDSRPESWCLRGERKGEAHRDINQIFEVDNPRLSDAEIMRVCEQLPVLPKDEANRKRMSLAVVQPDCPPLLHFTENVEADDHPQMRLFEHDAEARRQLGAQRFPYQPRLRFTTDGSAHDLQLREWGAYEWLRKNGPAGRHNHPARDRLKSNPRLLIGNMNGHRNVWLVISILRAPMQMDLFAPPPEAA